jgi:tRNA(Ile)-lysidine synthase
MRDSVAVVMVSGGQDSLTLLHLLATRALGTEGPAGVHALHVNHHLRGEDSDADQRLVEVRCRALGVTLTVVDGTVEKAAGNVQEAARDARLSAARSAAGAVGAACVAVGHTLDDQVETMLYRLGRYGGLAALRGMRPREGQVVRPLLGVRRAETEGYCRAAGLEFAVDRGNEYPGYARTAVRRRVLPAWEEALPGAAEAAARAAGVAAEAEDVMDGLLAAAEAGAVVDRYGTPGAGEWSAARLLRLEPGVRRALLRRLLGRCEDAECPRQVVLEVEGLLKRPGSGCVALGAGWEACRSYDRLTLHRRPPDPAGCVVGRSSDRGWAGPVPLPVPGESCWGGLLLGAAVAPDGFRASDPRVEAYVDARAVAAPLVVRGPRAGDMVRPLGASGSRLVQDLLVDMKVPAALRQGVPLVLCRDRVVWVCGLAQSQESRIMKDTERVVRLSVGAWPAADGGA